MSTALIVGRILAALPAMERAQMVNFMQSHRHGLRELERLTEQLAGELFIQCLMDPALGLDQDELTQAIGDTQAKIISVAMWSTLCTSQSALERFRVAYASRYIQDVLARLSMTAPAREAA